MTGRSSPGHLGGPDPTRLRLVTTPELHETYGHLRECRQQHAVRAGKEPCGVSQGFSFSPGGHVNFIVRLHELPNAYHFGCFDTFSMKS